MFELIPGVELGARFVLIRRLGRGGTAEVWLADDRERGEKVALKIFDPIVPPDQGFAARLAAEIARSRLLPPESAVPIHGVVDEAGYAILVMAYEEGGDLGQFRGRSFEGWARAVDEVAAALAAAHSQGLVHRDLKCGNVLLDGAGHARLADFGLATLAGSRAPDGGSPYNASPQQLRGEPALPADDLYAFGALLYELIAGHPPYYPEITRDRVLHEPVPPLVPRGAVPVGVRELTQRLLAKSPRERPASAAEARALLAAAAVDESGVIAPIVSLPTDMARRRRGSWLMPAALAVAAAAAIASFIWLQPRLADTKTGIDSAARAEAEQTRQELKTQAERLAEQKAARTAAEAARDKYTPAFEALDSQGAARWATADFAQARDAGGAATQRYDVTDYAAAAKTWQEALATLEGIGKRKAQVLNDALKQGQAALAAADTAAAREAFARALAIESGNAVAKAGNERAGKLDQALAIVDAALADERGGRPSAAEEGYRKALAVDPAVTGAHEGLARIAARRSGDAYSAAMSRGLGDLAAGRNDSARAAFRDALALRPSSQEARDALSSLDQGQRSAALRLLESRARAAEADERWDQALTAWREAAAMEPTLEFAREGIEKATPRAELQRRIEALNREPQRLWDPAGRAEARGLLATAAATGNPRQRLAAAARELERLAASAQTPVRLKLRSDGMTSVAIYRVGQYGAFAERDVELLPGRYTVVGTRNGYRDVRREVVLPPGAAAPAVLVRCEEPI